MKNKRSAYIATGALLGGALLFSATNQDFIYKGFTSLGELFHLNGAKSQGNTILAQHEKLMNESNVAIAAAESALAEAEKSEAVEEADAQPLPAWVISDSDDIKPITKLHEKVKLFSAVKVDAHPNTLPSEGEQIVLPLLNGRSAKVNVESTQTSDTGDYVWSGHLDGHESDYPVVMTYGANTTFATITTPEGMYTMESVNGVGWLYKNPSEFELSKPGAVDFLEPNI